MHPNYNSDPRQAPQGGAYDYQQATPPQWAPPQAATYGHQQQGPPRWTTGLCGCFEDPGGCIKTFCCPCITVGQNAEIIDKGTTGCCCGCLIYFALANVGCYGLYSFSFRSRLRGLYALPEEPCADCCVHCLLPCCAISQENRELKNRGLDPSIGWIANSAIMNPGGYPAPPHVAPGMYR